MELIYHMNIKYKQLTISIKPSIIITSKPHILIKVLLLLVLRITTMGICPSVHLGLVQISHKLWIAPGQYPLTHNSNLIHRAQSGQKNMQQILIAVPQTTLEALTCNSNTSSYVNVISLQVYPSTYVNVILVLNTVKHI